MKVVWGPVYVSAKRGTAKASCCTESDHEVGKSDLVSVVLVVCEMHPAFVRRQASCGSTSVGLRDFQQHKYDLAAYARSSLVQSVLSWMECKAEGSRCFALRLDIAGVRIRPN